MTTTPYSKIQVLQQLPRIPFKASIDLTYRCNNDCRHCWVRLGPRAPEKQQELTTDEIFDIVNQAKALGCREWAISGGEPMLRPDFYDIFDYITRNSKIYSLNTNGTLITPKIARLMQERKGMKMVALYGASKEVYEDVSRIPGSYDAAMRGFRLLKEAGAGFVVQVIPMKANYHEYDAMIALAKELSPDYRIGAPWLYLSADGDEQKNNEIRAQRLPARVAVELDPPQIEAGAAGGQHACGFMANDNLYESCISIRRDFYIDPYGRLTFCSFIRDPELMYDVRQGSIQDAWDNFIPSLKDKYQGGQEYQQNCATCEYRSECRWCGVYGYLEHGRHTAKVEYLCQVARETRAYKDDWLKNHRRYFNLAGISIQLESEIPFQENSIHPDLQKFYDSQPDKVDVKIYHYFEIPEEDEKEWGEWVKEQNLWNFYRHEKYGLTGIKKLEGKVEHLFHFNPDQTIARFFHRQESLFQEGGLHFLTFPTREQLLLTPVLVHNNASAFHSSAFIYKKKGFIFLGQSGAGKSTMIKLMREHIQILCDEINIIRKWPDGSYKVHGTWNHGELPELSAGEAPLIGLFFLKQADANKIAPMRKIDAIANLTARALKTVNTRELWQKQLAFFGQLVDDVPIYELSFDRSGYVKQVLDELLEGR